MMDNAILIFKHLIMRCYSIDRYFGCQYRFRASLCLKSLLCLMILYLFNILIGLQDYLWLEKSFDNEYHLTMTRIDINQDNLQKRLGLPKYILPNDFLLKNEHFCHRGNSETTTTTTEPHLLILVKSAVQNRQARQAIRMTWAKKNLLEKNSIKVAFVLGAMQSKQDTSNTIEQESQQYEDIIQIDKIDDYYHNSYKMNMMLNWLSNYCTSNSSTDLHNYVLFIDDDYYLDLNSLLTFLTKLDQDSHLTISQRRTYLTGYVYDDSRPRRFLNDRWYISLNDYPYDRYPPYVTAGCFLMTRSNARLFHLASKYLPLFRFDDIYLGLLAYSMSIDLIPNNHLFSSYSSSTSLLQNQTSLFSQWQTFFSYSTNDKSRFKPICIHGYRGEELIHIWNDLHQTNLTLPLIH